MPKNKNQSNKPNGFVLYANEIKNQLLKEGHEIRNMPDLIHAASPKWQALPFEERDYYKEKAKWEWDNRHITGKFQARPNRMDTRENLIVDCVDTVRMNQKKREKERQEAFLSFQPGRAVLEQKFYFVSFICLLEEPSCQPIELGVVEFSLLHGIERSMHKHINPGPIPVGYRYTAEQRSELTHKLPVEGKMDPHDNYTKIYDELFHFLSKGTHYIPPIFVKIWECERVDECLKWLAANAGRPNQLKRVYELEGLMLDLDNHLYDKPQNLMQFKQPATEILSSSVFDWDSGTRCAFHEDEDNETESKFCALGNVNRYCYCIADYFCKSHDIPLTEHHLPTNHSDAYYTVIPSNDLQNTSRHAKQQRQRQRQRQRDDSSSTSVYSEINQPGSGEDIANLVAERLRLQAETEERFEKQNLEEEELEKQRQEEQKKRWMALRGSPSKPSNPSPEQATNSSDVNSGQKLQQQKLIGRGRGRGAVMVNNLRRPGEKPVETPQNMDSDGQQKVAPLSGRSYGRGTKLHIKTLDESAKYAGSTPAPHPSEAPKPPRAWMS